MTSETLGAGSLGDKPETSDAVLGDRSANGGERSRISQVGRSAAEQIDRRREAAAGKIDNAAQALRDKAASLPGGEAVSSGARKAAASMSSAAQYIRDTDVDGMVDDVKAVVRDNPGPVLLGALLVGFLIARSFYADND